MLKPLNANKNLVFFTAGTFIIIAFFLISQHKPIQLTDGEAIQSVTAAETVCSDSDNGKNYWRRGDVRLITSGVSEKDVCAMRGMILVEYFCNERDEIDKQFVLCVCGNGVCASGDATPPSVEIIPQNGLAIYSSEFYRSGITIKYHDGSGTGVNLDSVILFINGKKYDLTINPTEAIFLPDPEEQFPKTNEIEVHVRDYAGNLNSLKYTLDVVSVLPLPYNLEYSYDGVVHRLAYSLKAPPSWVKAEVKNLAGRVVFLAWNHLNFDEEMSARRQVIEWSSLEIPGDYFFSVTAYIEKFFLNIGGDSSRELSSVKLFRYGEDTIAPQLSRITIDPPIAPQGSFFKIRAKVFDLGGIDSVKAIIKKSYGADIVNMTLQAGDSYEGVWDSSGSRVEVIMVDIEAKDRAGNIVTINNQESIQLMHTVDETKCINAAPLHNNPNDYGRINVVFTASGFSDPYIWNDMVRSSIDLDAYEYSRCLTGEKLSGVDVWKMGLMQEEPFKSNKNKFNFWYVYENGPSPGYDDSTRQCSCGADLDRYCDLPNKHVINFCNNFGRSNNRDRESNLCVQSLLEPSTFYFCGADVVVHEFGHNFGKLADEYVESSKGDRSQYPNCASNINEAREWWGDLEGLSSYNFPELEEFTTVGYYDGCAYVSSNIKPVESSIMMGSGYSAFGFGPVNIRALCKKIKEITGSAGGVCSNYNI